MQPRVTIVIATYNRSNVLRCAIGSVLLQTYDDFELLVIGDGCTDDSPDVVASFQDARIRWINLPGHTGHQSNPNNEGLRQARGEIIAYLGHDDLWLRHHLESMVGVFDATGCALVYGLCANVAPAGDCIWPSIPNPKIGSFSPPSCMAHRKEVTQIIGGWRDWKELKDTTPEVELWGRAQAAGYEFAFTQRLTTIKFPASWRKDVYRSDPCHEQSAWLARIRLQADLEPHLLVDFIVGATAAPIGCSYKEIVRHFVHQTLRRLQRRVALRSQWFGLRLRPRRTIDAIRQYKGL